jgi:O-antigen ligase
MMTAVSRGLPKVHRFALLTTLCLVESVVWLNTANSGIAKQPLFFIGASVSASLLLTGCILRGRLTFPVPAAECLIILHIPLFVISALANNDPAYTREALSFGVSCLMFFFAGSAIFPTRKNLEFFIATIGGLTVLLSLIAAVQYFFGESLPLDFHPGTGRRVASLLGNAEYFGTYLVTMTPLMIARALTGRNTGRFAPLRWGLPAGMILLLIATQSRSAILGCAASLLLFVLLVSDRRGVHRAIFAGGFLIAGLFIIATAIRPDWGERVWESAGIHRGTSMARRVFFWQGGEEAFLHSPLSGHGNGSYERTLFRYRSPSYWESGGEDIVPHAHNEIVEIAVEYGIIGLLLFAGTLTVILGKGIRTARRTVGWGRFTSAALVSGIAGAAVDGLASVSLRQPPVAMPVWLMMGMLVSPALAGRHESFLRFPVRLPKGAAALPFLLCLIGIPMIVASAVHTIRSDTHLLRGSLIPERLSPGVAAEYREAVDEDYFNLHARSELTLAFLDSGRWSEALIASEELQRLSPRYPKNHMMKAYALLRLGRTREALVEIEAEIEERSHPEAFAIEAAVRRSLADSQGERNALLNLLRADIRGRIPYGVPGESARLMDLSATEPERREASALDDSLAGQFGIRHAAASEDRDGD